MRTKARFAIGRLDYLPDGAIEQAEGAVRRLRYIAIRISRKQGSLFADGEAVKHFLRGVALRSARGVAHRGGERGMTKMSDGIVAAIGITLEMISTEWSEEAIVVAERKLVAP